MSTTVQADRQRQMKEAEELFGTEKTKSFAKGLFFGRFDSELLFPYPRLDAGQQAELDSYLPKVREFLSTRVDSYTIDKEMWIPESLIGEMFDMGVMTMSIPREHGGMGFTQQAYCRVIEEIGGADGSLAVLVNAHQSIGIKGVLLFGTEAQKAEWLPKLVRQKMLGAFALTEPNAGSDAAGIETRAILNEAGTHYVINGRKQWITNGGIAGLLEVMAKVPGTQDEKGRERITAFLVTPDMPGFIVEHKQLEKCGIRGTATGVLRFENVHVPVENILGPPGKGLRVALTLLDYGRTTFGATCTGAAKRCLRDAIHHAKTRHQFGKPLGHFELVKRKIANMAALTFAMESANYATAGMIDRGLDDYMLETAMLKVFASESLWEIVNETIQIFGGRGFMTEYPYERMMRDARLNLIGEGANDVLRTFIGLVGMRDVGMALKDVLDAVKSPLSGFGKLTDFAKKHLPGQDTVRIPMLSREIADLTSLLEDLTRTFGRAVEGTLIRYREEILDKQYLQARISDAAMELYIMSAVVSRLDSDLQAGHPESARNQEVGRFYCRSAERRIRRNLDEIGDNLDRETTALADLVLA